MPRPTRAATFIGPHVTRTYGDDALPPLRHLRCDPPSASSSYMEYKPAAAKPVFAADVL